MPGSIVELRKWCGPGAGTVFAASPEHYLKRLSEGQLVVSDRSGSIQVVLDASAVKSDEARAAMQAFLAPFFALVESAADESWAVAMAKIGCPALADLKVGAGSWTPATKKKEAVDDDSGPLLRRRGPPHHTAAADDDATAAAKEKWLAGDVTSARAILNEAFRAIPDSERATTATAAPDFATGGPAAPGAVVRIGERWQQAEVRASTVDVSGLLPPTFISELLPSRQPSLARLASMQQLAAASSSSSEAPPPSSSTSKGPTAGAAAETAGRVTARPSTTVVPPRSASPRGQLHRHAAARAQQKSRGGGTGVASGVQVRDPSVEKFSYADLASGRVARLNEHCKEACAPLPAERSIARLDRPPSRQSAHHASPRANHFLTLSLWVPPEQTSPTPSFGESFRWSARSSQRSRGGGGVS